VQLQLQADEDEREPAGGSLKTKRMLAVAATGRLRQHDAAQTTRGQSRGEHDGTKREREEFGITEEDSSEVTNEITQLSVGYRIICLL
jgi:hypothetical protein